jgi:DNA-binding HxlR family transcriptional regulator
MSAAVEPRKNALSGAYRRRARRNPVTDCPLTAAFAAIGGKWKLIIIYWLAQEDLHFAALRRRIPSISHKVLTEQLRELESDEIVRRNPRGPVPAPVVYRLTDYGRTLLPLVEGVRSWGRGHIDRTAERSDAVRTSPPARPSSIRN